MFLSVSECVNKDRNLSRLSNFFFAVINQDIPSSIRSIFFGARLLALNKKCGGIRPIAIGNCLRRMAAKLINKYASRFFKSHFLPIQFGAGAKCGSEYVIHSTRSFVENNPKAVIIKIDFANAFNCVDRSWLLSQANKLKTPGLKFILNAYDQKSSLFYNETIIDSQSGVQQGDPLGPFLFCLAIQPIIKSLKSPLNRWYMDDGTIGGSQDEVLQDFQRIEDECLKIGLKLNISKCEIFNGPHLNRDFKVIDSSSFELLGAPILKEATDITLGKRLESFHDISLKLQEIPHHHAFTVLKSSLGVCRLISTLRSSPCNSSPMIKTFDDAIRRSLESTLNVTFSEDSFSQAVLPIKMGGFGISSLKNISSPSYLSSFFTSQHLYDSNLHSRSIAEYLERWQNITQVEMPSNILQQKSWTQPIYDKALNHLKQTASPSDSSRLNSVSHKFSGDWLHCLPSKKMGLFLSNEEFRVSSSLRLGIKCFEPHKCPCNADINSLGSHCFTCKRNNGRILRHTMVNEIISRALKSANCPNIQEPAYLDEGRRPDGITTIPFRNGLPLAWDFTCPHPLVPSAIEVNKKTSDLCNQKEILKIKKYECLKDSYDFRAIAIDSLGAYGPIAFSSIKEIGKRQFEFSGCNTSCFFLRQRISIAIQKGNYIIMSYAFH